MNTPPLTVVPEVPAPVSSKPVSRAKEAWQILLGVMDSWQATASVAVIIGFFCFTCFANGNELYSDEPALIFIKYLISVFAVYLPFFTIFDPYVDKKKKQQQLSGKRSSIDRTEKFRDWFLSFHVITHFRVHILAFGGLMIYSTTFLTYSVEQVRHYRINGVILSEENPLARCLPFNLEWVSKNQTRTVDAVATTRDGHKVYGQVMAEMTLSKDPEHWNWQKGIDMPDSTVNEVQIDRALQEAFLQTIATMLIDDINRDSIVIDTLTGANIRRLDSLGVRLQGTVTATKLKPYFGD